MCGRFTLTTLEGFQSHFDLEEAPPEEARYNIAPTDNVAVVCRRSTGRRLQMMEWGLIPRWTSPDSPPRRWINARSESVDLKPAFRDSFRYRRCLVPSDGFFEWIKGEVRRPVYFTLQKGGIFAYAGLWDRWADPRGEPLYSCTILTTDPNDLVRPIHDRMPVILPPELYGPWMDQQTPDRVLKRMLQPFPAEIMSAREVDRYVNRAGNEGPRCIQPVQQSSGPAQGSLF